MGKTGPNKVAKSVATMKKSAKKARKEAKAAVGKTGQ